MNQHGIRFAFTLDGHGGGLRPKPSALAGLVRGEPLTWVHLDAADPLARQWLEKELTCIEPAMVEALLATETRPRIQERSNGALAILRGVNLNEGEEPEDMVSVRLWLDPHRIISLSIRGVKAVHDVEAALAAGSGPVDTGDFLAQLLMALCDNIEPALAEINDHMDNLEERVPTKGRNGLRDQVIRERVVDIRRQAILMRRHLAPQREALAHLRLAPVPWLEARHTVWILEAHDRTTRYIEDLDALRERAQLVKDELLNAYNQRLNRNIYVLSMVTVIFLPLGFVSSLFGINVGGIPGAEDPYAFWWFCGMLLALVSLELAIFRWLRWF